MSPNQMTPHQIPHQIPHWVLGVMSGTALDGVDVAYIKTNGEKIEELGAGLTVPYPNNLRDRLIKSLGKKDPSPIDPDLENDLTSFYEKTIHQFIQNHKIIPDVIGLHGQTIYHHPPYTKQLGNGQVLAEALGIPIVHDFRSADLRAGGQGAPLVPIFHQAMIQSAKNSEFPFPNPDEPTAVINIGGVANITWINGNRLIAGDIGPGMALLDDFFATRTKDPYSRYDMGGKKALLGHINEDMVFQWMCSDFYQLPFPKSLDRQHFAFVLKDLETESLEDGLTTLAALTARSISDAIYEMPSIPEDIYLTGGGRLNRAILQQLQQSLSATDVHLIDEYCIDGDMLEAYAFGYLAVRVLRGLPTSFPTTTGCIHPICGGMIAKPTEFQRACAS